jgi:hypothetical protein
MMKKQSLIFNMQISMKTRFFISIAILVACLSGCDDEVTKDPVETYVYVNLNSVNLFFGDQIQLSANPVGGTFTWASLDPAIATVSATGLVEAVGVGSTDITVTHSGASTTAIPVTVTVPTVDKFVVVGGEGKFYIGVQTLSERIKTARIFWNNGADSTDIAIEHTVGSFSTVVDYSNESNTTLSAVCFDKFGNRSIPSEVTATMVTNRNIVSAQVIPAKGTLSIQWGPIENAYCEFTYTDQSGQPASKRVLASESATELSEYKSDFRYRTVFDILALQVELPWITPGLATKIPQTGWTVISVSADAQDPGMGPEKAIDGDPMTTWHTKAWAGQDYPHHLTVDFGHEQQIDGIVFQNRLDDPGASNGWPKSVKWSASNDNSTWTELLSIAELTRTGTEMWLPCTTTMSAQYLRLDMYSGWDWMQYAFVGDMTVYQLK